MTHYLTYFRDYIILVFIQSAIVQFCLNQTIVPRFGLTPFAYYEIFLLCIAWFTVSHNYRLSMIVSNIENLKEVVAGCGLAYLQISATLHKELEEIKNKIKGDK